MKQLILLFIFISTLFSNILNAKALPEYTLKTAYLYNFALLTNWPEDEQTDNFHICFYKEDFGEASEVLENKDFSDKKIKIFTISNIDDAKTCQVVFIREDQEKKGKELIQELLGKHILIVSENKNLTDSHITISQENHKLVFDVSLKTLKMSDLAVSSRLLKLARKVKQ
jgi:hypothetical protein